MYGVVGPYKVTGNSSNIKTDINNILKNETDKE